MISGCAIRKILMILRREDVVAVAVNAITRTVSGMMLLTSPKSENSFRKDSPLQKNVVGCETTTDARC